jgi:hypothetical protein
VTAVPLLVALLAQAPTGYVSLFADHLPNRDATELRARVSVDEKADLGSHLRVTASGFADGLVASRRGAHATDAVADARELTLTIRGRRAELSAGLGRVVWGRLDELQPTDVVNPLDVSRFFFEGRSEARLAVPLVRAAIFAGEKASLEAVYVPFFRRARFDRLDEPTSPFNLAPTQPAIDEAPARTAGHAQGGARLNVTSGRVDWSISAYDGFRPFGVYSLTPAGALRRTYPRFTMLGGDVETATGAWVVRAEAALFTRDTLQVRDSPAVASARSFDAGGGVDRKAGGYRVSGEVILHREESVIAKRTDVSIVASANRQFARQKYEGQLFAVYNPRGGSGFVRGIAAATLRDNLKLEGSIGWFAGSGADTISRFSDSDFLYVRLRRYF